MACWTSSTKRTVKARKWSTCEYPSVTRRGASRLIFHSGFGSIVVSDPEEMTRCVVEAVVNSDVYAILSKGWSDRGSKAKGDTGDAEGADGVKYPDQI